MAKSPFKLNIGQINAGRGMTSMADLRQAIDRYNLDITCIQELYLKYGKLGSIPKNSRQIFDGNNPTAAIIISNPDITVTRISQGTDLDMTTVEISIKGIKITIINQYCKFCDKTEDHMAKLAKLKEITRNKNVLYMADVNARSTEWHSDTTNKKGEIVMEALDSLGLEIVNKGGQPPTFHNNQGHRSNIDTTAATKTLASRITNWKVSHEHLTSDHGLITMEISGKRLNQEYIEYKKNTYKIKNANWKRINEKLTDTVPKHNLMNTAEEMATGTVKWVQDSCERNQLASNGKSKKCSWWISSLDKKRAEVKRWTRIMQSVKDEPRRIRAHSILKEKLNEYKKGIQDAKHKT